MSKTKVQTKVSIRDYVKGIVDKAVDRILKGIEDALKRAIESGYQRRKEEIKSYFKQTEKRLYAYPELIANIEKYRLDIQDLEKEGYSGRSKDIVRIPEGSGMRLTPEQIQQARIASIQRKIERDQAEIDEINYALDSIQDDQYYMVIEYKYFEGLNDVEIGEKMFCDESTVRRHKSRLIKKLAVKLYGADAIE